MIRFRITLANVIPLVIRKFRSISVRQWQCVGVAFIMFMAAGPVGFLIFDFRGRRAWEDYEASERARGAKLTLADFAESPVPDEDNFGALPIFRNTLTVNQRLPELPRADNPSLAIPEFGIQFQAEEWRTLFARAGWIDTPSEDVSSDLRLALLRFDGALRELAEGLKRPYCSFSITWNANPYRTPFPHLPIIRRAAYIATLRASASLLGGNASSALEDLRLLVGVRDKLTSDLTTGSAVTCNMIARLESAILYEGLSQHAWNTEQLKEIGCLLESRDPLRHLARGLETERAVVNGVFDWAVAGNLPATYTLPSLDPDTWFDNVRFLRLFSGIARRNQLVANRYFVNLHSKTDLGSGTFFETGGNRLSMRAPYYVTATVLTSGNEQFIEDCLITTARFRLGAAACALELYRMQYAAYPENLGRLIPSYLSSVPHEPASADPVIYYPTDDGMYQLYSRSLNGEDDGGSLPRGKAKKPDLTYYRLRNLRDLSWAAPPVP